MSALDLTAFDALVEHSRDVIALMDATGSFRYVSPSVEEISGFAPEELIGISAWDFLHPDDLEAALAELADTIAGGAASKTLELRAKKKDGSWMWIEVRAQSRLDDPRLEGIVLNYHDITQRKVADERIRFQAEVLDRVPAMVVVIDPAGNVTHANRAVEESTGHVRDDVIGRNALELFALPEEQAVATDILRRLAAGERWEGRWTTLRRDGSRIPTHVTANPWRNEVGDITGSIVVGLDISDRLRLEEQLNQAQKMEAVGRLAGGVAHDFNNLLAVIVNYTDFVRADLEEDDPRRSDLDEVRAAAERGSDLVKQLLSFARRDEHAHEEVAPADVVLGLRTMLQRILGEDIDLRIKTACEDAVRVSRAQLEQVLMNLSINARDAMEDGGRLSIEVTRIEIDGDSARFRGDVEPGQYVCLAVSDTGCGMEPTTIQKLFEPFFTTKPQGKGTGLGLATTYSIVQRARGHITVYSEPGLGSTFRVYLPTAEDAQVGTAHGEPQATTRRTILVVEDEAGVRTLIERILTRHGYRVVATSSGVDALALLAEGELQIDALLTDVVMPEISGKELAERLSVDVPVLFMSGYPDDIVAARGMRIDDSHFIQKPFNARELLAKLVEVLP